MLQRILVWDIPTRVFHWALALSFAGAYLTSEGERYRDIHLALGYLMLGLIVFRLVWGLVGSAHARFSAFLYQPGEIMAYLRSLPDKPKHYLGHNPAGALAIFLLLGLGLMATLSGISLYWEWGGEMLEDPLEELHEVAGNLMLLLVFVHIAGVFVSSFLHKENLVRSMITGYKQGDAASAINNSSLWLGALMLAGIIGFLLFFLV